MRHGHRHTGGLMWQEHTEQKGMVGARLEGHISESLFGSAVSGAEPLKIWGGKRPSLTFRKTAGWREIEDISFWKQRDQYCSYSGQLRLRQWE